MFLDMDSKIYQKARFCEGEWLESLIIVSHMLHCYGCRQGWTSSKTHTKRPVFRPGCVAKSSRHRPCSSTGVLRPSIVAETVAGGWMLVVAENWKLMSLPHSHGRKRQGEKTKETLNKVVLEYLSFGQFKSLFLN